MAQSSAQLENQARQMRTLLVLSYHFRPLNAIASLRANAFADYLPQHGIYPIILTHDWIDKGNEHWEIRVGGNPEVSDMGDHKVIRLPLAAGSTPQNGSSLTSLLHMRKGRFDLGGTLPASRSAFESFLSSSDALTEVDGVLAIYNPHHHLELGHAFAQKRAIPFCADLRDLWSADAESGVRPHEWRARLRERLVRSHWKRWLSDAALVSTVSPPLVDVLEAWLGRPAITVRNGVETGLFDGDTGNNTFKKDNGVLTLSHVGTLYPEQPLETLGRALSCLDELGVRAEVRFIGLRQAAHIERVQSVWKHFELQAKLTILPRVTRKQALAEMHGADALYYPSWPDRPGIVSGKIYEYLASGTPVLITTSGPGMDVAQLVEASPNGSVFGEDDSEGFAAKLKALSLAPVGKLPALHLREAEVERWAVAFLEAAAKRV